MRPELLLTGDCTCRGSSSPREGRPGGGAVWKAEAGEMSPALPAGAAISPAGPGLASLWRQRSGEIGDTPAVPPRNPPDSECELTGVGGGPLPTASLPPQPAGLSGKEKRAHAVTRRPASRCPRGPKAEWGEGSGKETVTPSGLTCLMLGAALAVNAVDSMLQRKTPVFQVLCVLSKIRQLLRSGESAVGPSN